MGGEQQVDHDDGADEQDADADAEPAAADAAKRRNKAMGRVYELREPRAGKTPVPGVRELAPSRIREN